MSTVLTREAIQSVDDRQIELVEVPEWGGSLYVRGLSGTDRDAFDMSMIKGRGRNQEINLENLRARLIVRTAVDGPNPAEAKPLFELQDVTWLGKKSGAALQRVFAVAQRLSGLGPDQVEELTKDLGEEERDGSGSDSPLPLGIGQLPNVNEPSQA